MTAAPMVIQMKTQATADAAVRPIGCPDDCNLPHAAAEFGRLNGLSRSTVQRYKKRGMPYSKTTKRIPCKAARAWIAGKAEAKTGTPTLSTGPKAG